MYTFSVNAPAKRVIYFLIPSDILNMSFKETAIRKARFTEHQIITVLKSHEAGWRVKYVCRKAGISEVWKLQVSKT